jgi:hypothetical protein
VPADTNAEAVESEGPVPSVLNVVARTVDIMQSKIGAGAADDVALLIAPEFRLPATSTLGRLRRFSAGRAFIETGEAATEAALPRLAVALPWLRS